MKQLIIASLVLALGACAASNAPTTTAEGVARDSKISLLFQDFPAGTVCSVKTPNGTLNTTAMPSKIEYQAGFAASPVTCASPGGGRYTVNVKSVLPDTAFRVAGLTVYGTGLIVSTVSAGDLLAFRNENGVVRR